MNKETIKKVKKLMMAELQSNFHEYDDCGEVDCTGLAEHICLAENLYDDEDNIPEELFDLAFEVSEKFEKELS